MDLSRGLESRTLSSWFLEHSVTWDPGIGPCRRCFVLVAFPSLINIFFFPLSSKPGWVPLHYDRRLLMKTSGLIVYSVRSWVTEHLKGQLTLEGLNGLEALVGFYLIHHIKGPERLKSSTWAALLQSVSYSCLSCSSSLHSHILHDSILINCAVNSPQKCLEEHFRITQIWC